MNFSKNCRQIEEKIKKSLKTLKEDINNIAKTKVDTDGQTRRRLKRTEIVGF